MTTKHSRSEFNTLSDLVTILSEQWPAEELEDRLIKCMLERFSIELQRRRIEVRKEYRLNWHPERALAFAVACSHSTFQRDSQAENIALRLTTQIVQQTTTINTIT